MTSSSVSHWKVTVKIFALGKSFLAFKVTHFFNQRRIKKSLTSKSQVRDCGVQKGKLAVLMDYTISTWPENYVVVFLRMASDRNMKEEMLQIRTVRDNCTPWCLEGKYLWEEGKVLLDLLDLRIDVSLARSSKE